MTSRTIRKAGLTAGFLLLALSGCSSSDSGGDGSEGSEGGGDGGEDEACVQLDPGDTFDEVRCGARLILTYDSLAMNFSGTVENTTMAPLDQVRVEIHLSTGVELGPTQPVDLAPGATHMVSLDASSSFAWWCPHAEVSGCGEEGAGTGASMQGWVTDDAGDIVTSYDVVQPTRDLGAPGTGGRHFDAWEATLNFGPRPAVTARRRSDTLDRAPMRSVDFEGFDVQSGVEWTCRYDFDSSAFIGTLLNTNPEAVDGIRFSIELSNAIELLHDEPISMEPGEMMDVYVNPAPFLGWSEVRGLAPASRK